MVSHGYFVLNSIQAMYKYTLLQKAVSLTARQNLTNTDTAEDTS